MLVVLQKKVGEGFGVLLAAPGFARGVGNNALGFGLADPFASVGFDRFDCGEGSLFGAFLRHFFHFDVPTAGAPGTRNCAWYRYKCASLVPNGGTACGPIVL